MTFAASIAGSRVTHADPSAVAASPRSTSQRATCCSKGQHARSCCDREDHKIMIVILVI